MNQKTVFLISIDGMRPDALQQADTPAMDRLIQEGASTFQARTVMPSVTLPCHTSMLRGVDTPRHGITSNQFQPLARPVPSLIDAAKADRKRTGFFFNWAQLRDLCEPYSLDVSYCLNSAYTPETDWIVTRAAVDHHQQAPFDFLFLYLGYTDECGHQHGWMSQEYLKAIANADRCIAHLLDAHEATRRERTVLLLSDHGGHDRSHGTEMPEDILIPWVLSGHGVKKGHAIQAETRIFDTCPTLAHVLGIPAAREWDGQVVHDALLES